MSLVAVLVAIMLAAIVADLLESRDTDEGEDL